MQHKYCALLVYQAQCTDQDDLQLVGHCSTNSVQYSATSNQYSANVCTSVPCSAIQVWDAVHWSGWFAAGWAAAQEDYLPLSPTFRTLPAPFRTDFPTDLLSNISKISCKSFKDFFLKSAQEDYLPLSPTFGTLPAPFRTSFQRFLAKISNIFCKIFQNFWQKYAQEDYLPPLPHTWTLPTLFRAEFPAAGIYFNCFKRLFAKVS